MDHECTVYKTVDYLAKKWTLMILLELYKGKEWKRFTEIKNSMKEITPKMLSERLAELEMEGLVENRIDASSFPVRSEYRLTGPGTELITVIHDLKKWALKNKIVNSTCANQDCKICIL